MKSKFKLVFVGVFFVTILSCNKSKTEHSQRYIHNDGEAQGTTYSATYCQPEGVDLKLKIDSALAVFDLSLSTYNPNSVISKINRNENFKTDTLFETMYTTAHQVSMASGGAFDITVGPLVKAWGFAFGKHGNKKEPSVKELLPLVGYEKIKLVDHHLIKENPSILIDANAIGQGFAADVIGDLLAKNGCKNYIFELGGEVVCKGVNEWGEKWRVGVDKPIDDSTCMTKEIETVIQITDRAVTTSGNYRKYYYIDGKKYSHHINPHTGYPVVYNLLSATVVAPRCIQADAYATAFMVLGVDKALEICKKTPRMDCFLIYVDKDGNNKEIYTDGFKQYLPK
jgi:FAD:protein FMN transferase